MTADPPQDIISHVRVDLVPELTTRRMKSKQGTGQNIVLHINVKCGKEICHRTPV